MIKVEETIIKEKPAILMNEHITFSSKEVHSQLLLSLWQNLPNIKVFVVVDGYKLPGHIL